MEVATRIDSLTDCLIYSKTGRRCATEYQFVAKSISKQDAESLNKQGWKFDWSMPHTKNYEVYRLLVKDDDAVQGMIALKHIKEQYYTHVDIVEAAPWNVGRNGRYIGVGAHLFAIAYKLSWDVGNEGYVQFTAKTDLIEHYIQTLHAKMIDWHTLYIDSYGALALIEKYFGEAGDDDECKK